MARTAPAAVMARRGHEVAGMIRRSIPLALLSLALVSCSSGSATPSAPAAPSGPGAAPGSSSGAPSASAANAASVATAYLGALSRSDWSGAAAMEDPTMAAAAPASALYQIAAGLVAQYGAFGSIGSPTSSPVSGNTLVSVPVSFANATVTLNVAVTASGQVSGLHVAAVSTASAPPAGYVKPGAYTESAATVGSAPWTLPGTLTMPNGTGPFPAVVLVAGSGPADRNESFGPNAPFRDLAWGLASAGIAVLRYDKRTLVYAKQMAADPTITVRQETTDDAVAAIALLRQTPKVDPARVFVVGHSLGATLAPRIAAQAPGQLAGIAMLEAASTPLPKLMLEQTQYLASLQPSPGPSAEAAIAALQAAVALAESPTLSASTPASELPGGVPASYWLDLRSYDPTATAASLAIPEFFSQGGRDYQVPPSELAPWHRALAGHANASFHTYPAMDHLLLDGTGQPTPAEYSVPGHVDAQLVADLAGWVLAH